MHRLMSTVSIYLVTSDIATQIAIDIVERARKVERAKKMETVRKVGINHFHTVGIFYKQTLNKWIELPL